ncbi:MAG: HEAT repeat domain-containing protein [Candidatus Omnitrophica bacterium]|nr:HEAT repeat domain-containing protein [Candidatus Omnitrophota bacterium]
MKIKFSKKRLLIGIIILLLIYGIYLAGSCIFWYFAAWSGPEQKRAFKDSLRSLSSQQLIGKVHGLDPFTPVPSIAIEILAERKEKKAVPRLIKKLKSTNPDLKKFSIVALGKIGDPQAIEPLEKIVNETQVDIEYNGMDIPYNILALKALASMKYEPAYK